ncbi:MAG: ABC transporter substrate-binding protein [Candidatus Pacearchaeota archaeon]
MAKKVLTWLIPLIIVAIIIIAVLAFTIWKPVKEEKEEVIKIGVVAPLSGGGSVFGNSFLCGIKMALEDLNNTKYKYELKIEDDETNPSKSATAAQKLINIERVKAILSTTSGTGNVIAPLATEAKIPHITICSDYTIAEKDYNFNNMVFPEYEIKAFILEAKKRGVKSIALLCLQHPGTKLLCDLIKEEGSKENIDVVFDERFVKEVTDFKTIFLKAEKKNPDIYAVFTFPPQLEMIGRARIELGINKPLTTTAGFAISSEPSLFEGFWFIDTPSPNEEFIKKHQEKCPNVRFNVRTAPYGYSSLNLLVKAFEENKDNPIQYLDNLTEYKDVLGPVTKINRKLSSKYLGVWTIKDGKPIEIEKIPIE